MVLPREGCRVIKLALVQAAAGSLMENLCSVERFAREASHEGCEAVCFPECFLTGYHPEGAETLAISLDNPILSQISDLACQYALDILIGFMERKGDGFFITHGLFRRDGSRDYYRKTHLGVKEARFFSAGNALETFSLSCGLPIGIQLCVETHYPEITQTLALRGAEVIFAPHAAPCVSGDRERIWGKYIPARSYDNRVYMLCCNLWDETRFAGGCLVTDPKGEITDAFFADKEKLVITQIDRNLVAHWRTNSAKPSAHFFPTRRRPELYRMP